MRVGIDYNGAAPWNFGGDHTFLYGNVMAGTWKCIPQVPISVYHKEWMLV